MRGLKDTRAQHWTSISTHTIPFTIQKMQHAKSSQFSHRQHYNDYKSIAWNLGNSPRNSCCWKKKWAISFCTSCTLSPYIWTLQTEPDTKSSPFRKAINPFTLAHLRDMVHDKKDLFVFLRPVEESCHHVLWSTQAARRVLLEKKLQHFPSIKPEPGSAERHHKSELALSFQKSHQTPPIMANLYCMPLSLPPCPPALAESF